MGEKEPTRVRFRDATIGDVGGMARVHRNAYTHDHFLALLPESALADYYSRFLGEGSRAILAVTDRTSHSGSSDDILGFAVFGRNIEPRVGAFKRDRRAVIMATALSHPLLATRKVLMSVSVRSGAGEQHAPAPALLLSIAVARAGMGVGQALLQEMTRRAAQDGEARLGLYVRHRNVSAINAYLRAGFRIVESITDQYYMERDLAPVST